MKTILDVLNAVDDKFSDTFTWCKGYYAQDINGIPVPEGGERACRWCLSGCIISLTEENKHPGIADDLGTETLSFMSEFIKTDSNGFYSDIADWNDARVRTFADIKNIIKRAKENLINV